MYNIWPDNKKFAICLSHDVDRVEKKWWHSLSHFVKEKRSYHLKTLFTSKKNNPYWMFEYIMKLEEKYQVRSTFFFLNESKKLEPFHLNTYPITMGYYNIENERVKKIIKTLHKGGWEIGVHGSYDSYMDKNLLMKEKKILEEIINQKIYGIRQHYLNLKIPDTWIIQKNVGFKYDASFGSTRDIGFRKKRYLPFKPFRDDDFLVVPLTIMDSALFHKYPNPKSAWNAIVKLFDIAERENAIISVLWHQRVFNEKEFPGWSKMYEKIIQEGIKRNAWFGRCIDAWEVFSK